MRQFTCSPSVELLGQNIIAWEHNLQVDETRPIMEKYGLVNLDPDKWYPCIKFMDAMNEITKYPNMVSNFVAIGMEVGRIVPAPPHLTDPGLGDMLMSWDGIYQYIHRNGHVGKIACDKLSDTHYRLTFTDLSLTISATALCTVMPSAFCRQGRSSPCITTRLSPS